jgi:hypothetical protein
MRLPTQTSSKQAFKQGVMTMANQSNRQTSGRFPLDDLSYDLITIIHEKSKGLEAFDKYLRDAQGNERVRQSLEKMRQQDEQCIGELSAHLGYILGQSGQSGQTSGVSQSAGVGSSGSRR